MSDVAIKVENLGKKYIIRHEKQEPYKTFQDVLINSGKKIIRSLNPFDGTSGNTDGSVEEFWALKDVNFEIKKGDKVGIIGRNGAGKSTLLKVLSRITEPTTGKIHINGRIASLLEVGTGFHPELTGRENIFLNGAILGMSRAEIRAKFDEIVAFAEVEKFLDTPVKRYSSGMYVRLAFSVAAHLEPEILVVDEVLAVGDVEFQKKCLGKMGEVSKEGRTILFVSHNMTAIQQLCNRVIMLKDGSIYQQSDNVNKIVNEYLSTGKNFKMSSWTNMHSQYTNKYFTPTRFAIENDEGKEIGSINNNEHICVVIEGMVQEHHEDLQIGYTLYDEQNNLIYRSLSTDQSKEDRIRLNIGNNILVSKIPKRLLNEGGYSLKLDISIYCREWICNPDERSPEIFFIIEGGLSDSEYWVKKRPGIIAPNLEWKIG